MLLKNSPLSNTSEKLKSPQTSIKNIKFERKKDFKSFLKFIERESKALEEIKVPSLDETKKKKGSSFGAALGLGTLGLLALFGGRDGDPDDQPNKFDSFDPDAFRKSIARQSQITSLALVGQKAATFDSPEEPPKIVSGIIKGPNATMNMQIKNKISMQQDLNKVKKEKINQVEIERNNIRKTRNRINKFKERQKNYQEQFVKEEVFAGGDSRRQNNQDIGGPSGGTKNNRNKQLINNMFNNSENVEQNAREDFLAQKEIKNLNRRKGTIERLITDPNVSVDRKNKLGKELKDIQMRLGEIPMDSSAADDKKLLDKVNRKILRNNKVMNTVSFLSSIMSGKRGIQLEILKDLFRAKPFADGTMDAYLEREKKRKKERMDLISEISSKIITGEMEVPSLIDSLNLDKLKIPPVNYQLPIDGNNSDQFFIYPIDDGPSFTDLLMIKELEKY